MVSGAGDSGKMRLDQYLVEHALAESREKAKALIIAGEVRVDGNSVTAPSFPVHAGASVGVIEPPKYVSRGGLKLEKAIASFGISPEGRICADIGASTGGFTDCMLQHGAQRVYAVDVGYGQLAWKLRNDPRVVVMERTNARNLESLDEPVDLVSVDVAFISLLLILPAVARILAEDGEVAALIKPQFEAGKDKVGKKGVVRDPDVHQEVIQRIADGAAELGFVLTELDYSPIKGPNGNIEYLAHMRQRGKGIGADRIREVVSDAHDALK